MKTTPFFRESGKTIVELMIALTVGLIIMLALISLYVSNRQGYRGSDDKARLDEDGRLALNLLAFHVRMAGYGSLMNADPKVTKTTFVTPGAAAAEGIQGCSGGFNNASAVSYACKNGTATPDSIIVRYYVDSSNANNVLASASASAAAPTSLPTDCLGQGVIVAPAVVENRFFIKTNPSTNLPELYCAGNGGTAATDANFFASPQPIAENVTDMKITYGYDANGDQSVDAFYTAQQIDDPHLADPDGSTKWSRVVSTKICLVIRSANDGAATSAQKYRDCGGNLVTAADRRLYATFSTVVALRSRASGSSL